MTRRKAATSAANLRVGLFGLLGSGNIGNDASTEVIVRYLHAAHPDAVIDAMCMGWERMRDHYDMETVPLQWQAAHDLPDGPAGAALKAFGKFMDVFRVAAWVRRHDAVIVPGMGVMDASLPINPWGVPLSLFLLAASGQLLRTKVALVAVGAAPAKNPVTAWMYKSTARLVYYLSFRDEASRQVLRRQGFDTSRTPVYPDLVYSLQLDPDAAADPLAVGVGVMAYHGSNEDRDRADEIYRSYVSKMTSFVLWLLDSGRTVRLIAGDEVDQPAVDEVLASIKRERPDLDASRITGTPIITFAELANVIGSVSSVAATRFHSVMFGLKLYRPTISLGYSPKNDSMMTHLGLSEYVQHARSFAVEKLKSQFIEAEGRAAEIHDQLHALLPERSEAARAQLDEVNLMLFGSTPTTDSVHCFRGHQRFRWRRTMLRTAGASRP